VADRASAQVTYAIAAVALLAVLISRMARERWTLTNQADSA
jgi:hypothetical protein